MSSTWIPMEFDFLHEILLFSTCLCTAASSAEVLFKSYSRTYLVGITYVCLPTLGRQQLNPAYFDLY